MCGRYSLGAYEFRILPCATYSFDALRCGSSTSMVDSVASMPPKAGRQRGIYATDSRPTDPGRLYTGESHFGFWRAYHPRASSRFRPVGSGGQ